MNHGDLEFKNSWLFYIFDSDSDSYLNPKECTTLVESTSAYIRDYVLIKITRHKDISYKFLDTILKWLILMSLNFGLPLTLK